MASRASRYARYLPQEKLEISLFPFLSIFLCVMGVLSFILGVLLWKPLKQYQTAEPPRSGQSSDFVGYEFALSSLLDRETHSAHQFSGVAWRVELAREEGDKSLASGDRVRVVALHPGILVVAQA